MHSHAFQKYRYGKTKDNCFVQSVTCLWNILLKPNSKEFSMEQIYTYVYMCVYIYIQTVQSIC